MSQLFASGDQIIGASASASVLPVRLFVFLVLSLGIFFVYFVSLKNISFLNIFCQSVVCFLMLLTEQKFLILMKSSLSVLSFLDYTLLSYLKK